MPRRLAGGLAIAVAIGVALDVASGGRRQQGLDARPAEQRPPLLLLTSLPLLFNEDFSLSGGGSPALASLQTRYRVIQISVTDRTELSKGRLLMMAQPQAQTPQNLVALDNWVRAGGRAMLFADPMLEWPSKRPLGDMLRPPPVFADTGLLGHWGLRLDPPDRRGAERRQLGGLPVLAVSPGTLSGRCAMAKDGFVAHCRIGKGEVTVVADADLLNTPALGSGGSRNLDSILSELAMLEKK
jgi:hypothetical protein